MSETTEIATRSSTEVGSHGSVADLDYGRMMELAIQKGVEGVEALERLSALLERQMDREARQAFNAAMLAVQQHMDANPVPVRGAVTVSKSGTTRPYPLLEDIQRTLNPVCAEHGISYGFDTETRDKAFVIILTIRHVMGHSETVRTTLPLDQSGSKNNVQGVGSTESYGMRYGLIKAFGLTRYLHDDDGAGGDVEPDVVSDEQLAHLADLLDEVKANVDLGKFFGYFGIEALGEMPAARYEEAKGMLERKR